jgi:hypothetical protein
MNELLKTDIKRAFLIYHLIKLPLISSHYFKTSTTGKIHIVHRIMGIAIYMRKIKFEYEGFTDLIGVDENNICKNCVHFHNQFKEVIDK